ncbi:MAG: hypothetical protein NC938_03305 [Candidatus Omnitrophica bacterium]|nr:hypothetical protein [Candidatus Omnitrophota bacterium]MCM8790709.1 hypothetical protein [Candidatus Omnitrophota bacterium]
MPNRYARAGKKAKHQEVGIDTIIERLKKVRALNCNPSDVGLDSYVWKSFFFSNSRHGIVTKLF